MLDDAIRFLHLVAAATWVGGLITLGALVAAVRQMGADGAVLQAMARRFGRVSWTAMGVAVASGVAQLARSTVSLRSDTDYAVALFVKLTLVGLAVGLALFHQFTAKRSSPAARGACPGPHSAGQSGDCGGCGGAVARRTSGVECALDRGWRLAAGGWRDSRNRHRTPRRLN
jgi:uncharacterized membrane protein